MVWTQKEDTIVRKVLDTLVAHAGLLLPMLHEPFVLETCATDLGYGGVLLYSSGGKLLPVGCASTLKMHVTGS